MVPATRRRASARRRADLRRTALILRELTTGPKRFGELRTALGTPSATTVTDRLRTLEHQEILTRRVHAAVPPKVVYELTDRGRSLDPVISALLAWGEQDAQHSA